MNILFVCKYNNFRSKFAEAIFNRINTDSSHNARSAGILAEQQLSAETQEKINFVAQKLGYTLVKEKNPFGQEILSWADVIINVASDVDLGNSLENKTVLNWAIDDVSGDAATFDARVSLVHAIEDRVVDFIKNLNEEGTR